MPNRCFLCEAAHYRFRIKNETIHFGRAFTSYIYRPILCFKNQTSLHQSQVAIVPIPSPIAVGRTIRFKQPYQHIGPYNFPPPTTSTCAVFRNKTYGTLRFTRYNSRRKNVLNTYAFYRKKEYLTTNNRHDLLALWRISQSRQQKSVLFEYPQR